MIDTIILKMIDYFDGDTKRINHALKVYGYALTIGKHEKLQEISMRTLEIAAVLHDIGIKESERKYNSSAGKYQEMEGPEVARQLLVGITLAASEVDRLCYLIGNHHSYSKIDGLDFQILVEADFLVNIQEDEMNVGSIKTVREKYFKTSTGMHLIASMYKA